MPNASRPFPPTRDRLRTAAARALRTAALATIPLWLAACGGGGGGGGGSSPADLAVTLTGPSEMAAGATGTFVATVTNVGGSTATEVFAGPLGPSGPADVASWSQTSLTCVAGGGAICPADLKFGNLTLPAGGSWTLTYVLKAGPNSVGRYTVALSSSSKDDTHSGNDVGSLSVLLPDPRSGRYVAFAQDGRQYALTVDYVANTWSVTGNGVDRQGSFTVEGNVPASWSVLPNLTLNSARTAQIAGNERLRARNDLVLGALDLGAGVRPFVAARSFADAIGQLSGELSILGTDRGAATTASVRQARWTGSALEVCADPIVQRVATCPTASVRTYALSVSGTDFTGVSASPPETIRFRMARSGGALLMLRAERDTLGTASFRVGLPALASVGAMFPSDGFSSWLEGPSDAGAWNGVTLAGFPSQFNSPITLGGVTQTSTYDLLSAFTGASVAPGLWSGLRLSNSAVTWAALHPAMTVVVGANGGPDAGKLEVYTP